MVAKRCDGDGGIDTSGLLLLLLLVLKQQRLFCVAGKMTCTVLTGVRKESTNNADSFTCSKMDSKLNKRINIMDFIINLISLTLFLNE